MSSNKPPPKRGRTSGRRRCVVAVSLDGNLLEMLDTLAATESNWKGRKVSRSAMVRKLICVGNAVHAGRVIHNMNQF